MSNPYLGEIRLLAFNFAPQGWALCNGQLLPITQNTALFSLLGTIYGGNGTSTFQLPNLQSRVPMHMGGPTVIGESAGEESHTLTTAEMPSHTHAANCNLNSADQSGPSGNFWAEDNDGNLPYGTSGGAPLSASAIKPVGGSQPHENRAPILVMNFCIALQGIFPSRS